MVHSALQVHVQIGIYYLCAVAAFSEAMTQLARPENWLFIGSTNLTFLSPDTEASKSRSSQRVT